MTITLTDAASKQIRVQIAKRGKGLGLRVGTKSVGCSGLAYTYEIADAVQPGEQVFQGQDACLMLVDAVLADPNQLWGACHYSSCANRPSNRRNTS